MAWRAARATSCSARLLNRASLLTTSASTPSRTRIAKASSRSLFAAGVHNIVVQSEPARRRVHIGPLGPDVVRIVRVGEQTDGFCRGHHLQQQLQALRPQLAAEEGHPRDIAAARIEARHQAGIDRIAADHEDDRNRRRRLLGGHRTEGDPATHDHGHLPGRQIGRQRRQPIILVLRPSVFDGHILPVDIAGLPQALAERVHALGRPLRRSAVKDADHRHRLRLRARHPRPRGGRAEKDDKVRRLMSARQHQNSSGGRRIPPSIMPEYRKAWVKTPRPTWRSTGYGDATIGIPSRICGQSR
jgi:hypothetical protein